MVWFSILKAQSIRDLGIAAVFSRLEMNPNQQGEENIGEESDN